MKAEAEKLDRGTSCPEPFVVPVSEKTDPVAESKLSHDLAGRRSLAVFLKL